MVAKVPWDPTVVPPAVSLGCYHPVPARAGVPGGGISTRQGDRLRPGRSAGTTAASGDDGTPRPVAPMAHGGGGSPCRNGSPRQGEVAVAGVRNCWQGWGAPGGYWGGPRWGSGSPSHRLMALDGRQAGEIRSQFQAVPTERCYQDGTCRTEYFKALSGPPSGAGTGATALAGGGGGGEGGRRRGRRPKASGR